MVTSTLNICIFCGARPNFMKVAPIIRVIEKSKEKSVSSAEHKIPAYTLVYAGKEDDPTLEGSLFEDLGISRPTVYLGVDCENLNELTGQVMSKFEGYLQTHPTDVVVVVDDLASTMAAAIVTKKQAIKLVHIAAGTRSFDITMPKEINRLVIDGLSDVLFTAGVSNNSIANKEGAELSKVYMVGNILIDNIRWNRGRFADMSFDTIDEVRDLQLQKQGYVLFTLNRKKLLGNEEELENLLKAIVDGAGNTPIVAPLRKPAAEVVGKLAAKGRIDFSNFHIVPPLSYMAFGFVSAHAKGVITDSGNVAEEATFNSVPCITLNSYTEHIETVKQGSNVLVGEDPSILLTMLQDMVAGKWKKCGIPDRWDGRSGERVVQTLLELR